MPTIQEENAALDSVILKRRTIRSFKNDDVPKESIEKIIKAGYLAPLGGMTGLTLNQVRKFIVMKNGTQAHLRAKSLIYASAKRNKKKLQMVSLFMPKYKKQIGIFIERFKLVSEKGIPGLEQAPYYIIIAEKRGMPPAKGVPPIEKQSMAHALENMWLKATALGLGFQLISATASMSNDREFIGILGLATGEYDIDGCAIGIAGQTPADKPEADPKEYINWLE